MGKPEHEHVSIETVRRRHNTLDRFDLVANQFGHLTADMKWGMRVLGPRSPMPNFRWEIDSTRIDLYVLDPFSMQLIRVRPTLYVVFDRYSEAPVGIHLDIHPPSTLGFLAAIRNAILPKTYVREVFPSIKSDWVQCGFPVEIFADNGSENWSLHTQVALLALRLGIAYLPPYVPRYKPGVERFFRTLNQLLFHKLLGTTLGKQFPRRELDPQRDAKFTLIQVAELLHSTIVDEYMNMKMGRGTMTHRRKFLQGLEMHDIELPTDSRAFDLAFCRPDSRVLRQTGIHIGDLRYHSEQLSLLHGRLGKSQSVKLLRPVDERSLFVLNPLNDTPFEVPTISKGVRAPLPYASLLPFSSEDLGVASSDDDDLVEEAKKRKRATVNSTKLRETNDSVSAADVRSTYGKAPSFQDMARDKEQPASSVSPAPNTALEERLRGRFRKNE